MDSYRKFKKHKKDRFEPLLPSILRFIALSRFKYPFELYSEYSYVNKRTLRRKLNKLIELKWVIRIGKSKYGRYTINPFLEFLIKLDAQFWFLLEFASSKIDLFDLLNIPLLNLLELRKKNPKTYQVERVKVFFYPSNKGYMKPIFCGVVQITLYLRNGAICSTILPINLHGQPTIVGYDKIDKKPIVEIHGIKHYCIPLKWSLFDVKETRFYSEWSEQAQRTVFLHFDNSIKILYQPDYQVYVMFKKPFDKAIEKWNGEQYIEFCEFETLRRLFESRFIKNKRRIDLFKELDLKLKLLTKRS